MKTTHFVPVRAWILCSTLLACGSPIKDDGPRTAGPASTNPTDPGCNPKLASAQACTQDALSSVNDSQNPGGQNAECNTAADCDPGFECGRLVSWNPSFEVDGSTAIRSTGWCLAPCAPVPDWDVLAPANCPAGFICAHIYRNGVWETDQGVCTDIATQAEGEACSDHIECHGTLACINQICSRYPEGWECQISDDCATGLVCWDTDYACSDPNGCSHDICRLPGNGAIGDACVDELDCADDLTCDGSTCAEPPPRP